MIALPHSSPNDFHNSFNNNTRSPDLTNPSITNYSSIAPSIPSSMYQTTQQSFVYTPSTNNNNLTNQQQQHFVVAAHSRSPSASTISRNSPADTASFAIDSGSFYRYDTTNNISGDSRSSPVQQSQALISNTMSSTPDNNSTTTNTTNSIGVNVLPPISEVLQQQQSSQQQQQQQQSSSPSTPVSSSPTQSQMVPNIQVQTQTSASGIPISMTTPAGQSVSAGFYQYSDVNAAYTSTQADQNFAAQSSLQQAMNQQAAAAAAALSQQHHQAAAQQQQQALSQQALDQNTSNGMVVDPRTLPPIVGTTASDIQLMDATAHRRSSILAINTAGIPVPGTDPSPISANSSTGSPILSTGAGATTITYHSSDAAAAAAQQALLTNFMAANNVIMQTPQRTVNTTTTGRRRSDTIMSNDPAAQVTMNSQPQKVYSFVPLPGINTKKRPRRRYDEIERHYSCEWPGCTKAYGTLNHLNAHVQMQKHGPKRHPSEFKELRKQWRRQKREEEERKAAAEAQAKQSLLNSNLTSI